MIVAQTCATFRAFWGIGRKSFLHTSRSLSLIKTKTGGKQLFLPQQLLPPDAVFLKKQLERGNYCRFLVTPLYFSLCFSKLV